MEDLEERLYIQCRRVMSQMPLILAPFWPPADCSAALESGAASMAAGAVEIRLGSRLVVDS